MAIGIVSHAGDDHALDVFEALCVAGKEPILIDTAAFPAAMSLSFTLDGGQVPTLASETGLVDLRDLEVIWWRRPRPYTLHPELDPAFACFAYSECHEAMSGVFHSLQVQWVNPPAADEVAHHKPLQLSLAQEIGLRIPRTLITNDPEAARAFIADQGAEKTIYKTFLAHEKQWRETRLLHDDEISLLASLRAAPVIFQEFIEAAVDLRVTIFGDDIQATEIVTASDAYQYDYRVVMDAVTMRSVELPAEIRRRLLALQARLGLVYGAVDLRRTDDGEFVFLEVNPSGEFKFVEERSGQDLTGAMASLLCRLDAEPAVGLRQDHGRSHKNTEDPSTSSAGRESPCARSAAPAD